MNYLYNGVELPDINIVWTDKETYPYAWITNVKSTDYWTICTLTLSNKAAVYTEANGVCIPAPYSCQIYEVTLEVTEAGKAFFEEYGISADDVINAGWRERENQSSDSDSGHGINLLWTQHGVAWSNHDILNADGSVYLSASDPIPVGGEPEKPTTFTPDPISMTMGWLVGRRIAAQRGKYIEPDVPDVPDEPEKQLIGYSYNGVVLPDINEVWTDKEAYPYAVITFFDASYLGYSETGKTIYQLYATDSSFYASSETVYCRTPHKSKIYLVTLDDDVGSYFEGLGLSIFGSWAYLQDSDISGTDDSVLLGTAIWSNTDILNTDGSVYLAASEPVPVYES